MRGSREISRSPGDIVGRNAMGIVRSSRIVGGVATRYGLGRLMRRVTLMPETGEERSLFHHVIHHVTPQVMCASCDTHCIM